MIKKEYKEVLDELIEFENKNDMFSVSFNGVNIWEYVRWIFMRDLFHEINSFDEKLGSDFAEDYTGKMTVHDYWEKYVRRNIRFSKKREVLLVAHTRKIQDDDCFKRDIVVYWLDKYLEQSHYVLDYVKNNDYYIRQKSENIVNYNLQSYMEKHNNGGKRIRIPVAEIDELIFKPIESEFNIKLSLKTKRQWYTLIEYIVNNKKIIYDYSIYILEKIKPKIILMAVSYIFNNQILCEAAKEKRIPIVELQHGQASDIHVAYNYKKQIELKSFPDYFFSFGQFEKDVTRWPISKDKVIPVGFPEQEESLKRNPKIETEKKIILFISAQPVELLNCAMKLCDYLDLDEYEINIKLHPMEIENANKYRDILGKSPVKLIATNDNHINYYLCRTKWVVGIESTVMYEATAYDLNIAILKGPKWDYSKHLIEKNYAVFVNNARELAQYIKEDSCRATESKYFYKKNSISNMEKAINDILCINGEN